MESDFKARRRRFDRYLARVEKGELPPPVVGPRVTCPCCGYPTLEERRTWDICPLCNWEDDGQDDSEADEVWGGPNRTYSLTDARRNFEQNGVKYDAAEAAEKAQSNERHEAEARIRAAMVKVYDAMLREPQHSSLGAQWSEIEQLEKRLYSRNARGGNPKASSGWGKQLLKSWKDLSRKRRRKP
jgi:hypothetical protein